MSSLIYEPEITTHTGKSTMNYYIFTSNQTTPPSITKQFPAIISKRLSYISCDKECFDKAAPGYNNALKNSDFNENFKFTPKPPYTKIPAKVFSGLIFTV